MMRKKSFSIVQFLRFGVRTLKLRQLVISYVYYNSFLLNALTAVNKLRIKRIELVVLLWPPAQNLVHEIKRDIEKKANVLKSEVCHIHSDKFIDLVRSIYVVDNASQEKISYKIQRLKRESLCVHVFLIRFDMPTMEAKDLSNHKRCKEMSDLKKLIREKYKHRIPNYIHDIIIHSTEAEQQNDTVNKLIRGAKL